MLRVTRFIYVNNAFLPSTAAAPPLLREGGSDLPSPVRPRSEGLTAPGSVLLPSKRLLFGRNAHGTPRKVTEAREENKKSPPVLAAFPSSQQMRKNKKENKENTEGRRRSAGTALLSAAAFAPSRSAPHTCGAPPTPSRDGDHPLHRQGEAAGRGAGNSVVPTSTGGSEPGPVPAERKQPLPSPPQPPRPNPHAPACQRTMGAAVADGGAALFPHSKPSRLRHSDPAAQPRGAAPPPPPPPPVRGALTRCAAGTLLGAEGRRRSAPDTRTIAHGTR